jgi:hypothetical protein
VLPCCRQQVAEAPEAAAAKAAAAAAEEAELAGELDAARAKAQVRVGGGVGALKGSACMPATPGCSRGAAAHSVAQLRARCAACATCPCPAATAAQAPLWKKKAAPARQRRTYKTAEDVLAEAAAGGGDEGRRGPVSQPILDLRGPQARLVTDLEQLNAATGASCGGVECVACGVWRVACGVWRVACGVWRVACGVWRVACGVWRVACGVWRVCVCVC